MVAIDLIVGIIGNVVSVISYLAPAGQFMEIVKKKSSENYDGSPYVTSLLSCCLWTFYGAIDPDDGTLVVIVSVIGVVTQVICLAILLLYYPKDKKIKYTGFIIVDLVIFGAVMAVTMAAFHERSRRTFVGIICATFTVVMYASPLTVVKKVIQTKTAEYMPVFLIFTLWLSGVVWLVFALLVSDFYILVPNAVGILLSTIQLLVYYMYRNSSSPSKSAKDGLSDMSKQGIIMQNLEEGNEPKEKNQSPPNGSNIRNPSLSRQYSFKQLAKDASLGHGQNETDLENGGS